MWRRQEVSRYCWKNGARRPTGRGVCKVQQTKVRRYGHETKPCNQVALCSDPVSSKSRFPFSVSFAFPCRFWNQGISTGSRDRSPAGVASRLLLSLGRWCLHSVRSPPGPWCHVQVSAELAGSQGVDLNTCSLKFIPKYSMLLCFRKQCCCLLRFLIVARIWN